MSQLLRNATLVSEGRITDTAWVEIDGSCISAVGSGSRAGGIDLGGRLLVPGFVDIHVHGAVGATFSDTDPTSTRRVVEYHRAHGTTTMLGGISGGPVPDMVASAEADHRLVESGDLDGLFYEGPYLSVARRGAHDPKDLQDPDVSGMNMLMAAGRGAVKLVTIAPELPGALDLIPAVTGANGVAAVGHTDASYEQAVAAFDAGATVGTHLFNGMRPIHHRDPGPVIAAMNDDRVTCELITDGFHLEDPVISFVFSTVGSRRVALITDAMEATGVGDGTYGKDSRSVVVKDGKAMLADGSSIAGSTLTMDLAVRRTVRAGGVGLADAILAATATPARAIRMEGTVGAVAAGYRADLVVLGDDLVVEAVMRRGSWCTGPWASASPLNPPSIGGV